MPAGDYKDELVMVLKENYTKSEDKVKKLTAELELIKKGTTGQDAELRAMEDMHR